MLATRSPRLIQMGRAQTSGRCTSTRGGAPGRSLWSVPSMGSQCGFPGRTPANTRRWPSSGMATFSGDSETFEDGGVSFGEHEYEILAWEGWNDCEPIRCLVRFVAPAPFIRGDANGDGGINLGDAVFILDYLFAGRNTVCEDAADVNDDGKVDLSDPIALLAHLFAGGLAPYPPFPEAGGDPTNDALRCAGA